LTRALGGPSLWVKRDDQTTVALGGNKVRKLEFLLADALAQGADTLVTAGGVQSNHACLTAAAAARSGLACELVLGAERPLGIASGNLLLDRLFGATVHWTSRDLRTRRMGELGRELRDRGHRPYVIPIGGSNALGTLGYVDAMFELVQQLEEIPLQVDHVVVATSSGGTLAGLQLGAKLSGFSGNLTGISIDQGPEFTTELAGLANASAALLEVDERLAPTDFTLNADYLGAGYGIVGDAEREAMALCARSDALLVGPVYTARAMAGLIDLIGRHSFGRGESVLFWHTGDVAPLFAYAEELF
jgi:D-cysteine desulfhydrase